MAKATAKDKPVEASAGPTSVAEGTEAAGLTIQDLSTALQIIQVVGSRGAIRAEEMSVVGSLYNKLHSFLEASGNLAKAPGDPTVAPKPADSAEEAKAPAKEPVIGSDEK